MIRNLLLLVTFIFGCMELASLTLPAYAANSSPTKLQNGQVESDGSNFLVKSILERVGQNLLRAIVIDRDGHEQRLLLTAEDAVELKRGLWALRPGIYQLVL